MFPEITVRVGDQDILYVPKEDASTSENSATPASPDTASSPTIGIAVTTRNRPEVFERFLVEHEKFCPPNVRLAVVDDASSKPLVKTGQPWPEVMEHRFERNVGIAKAKNKCIELLMAMGVEHLFIFDDDTWPIAKNWWEPYVNHPEPHFCYLFKDIGPGGKPIPNKPRTIYDSRLMFAYDMPRGCMLYLHRSVVERVGGYRPEFGVWGWEHTEYSERIHNAGLTLCRFQDVKDSDKLLWCADQNLGRDLPGFKRSVPDQTRRTEMAKNQKVYEQFKGTSDYVEYRELPNLVLTSCLNRVKDPQRKTAPALTPENFKAWERSLKGALPVVLHDFEPGERALSQPAPRGWRRAAFGANPYIQRWVNAYQALRHLPAKWVWCTDGTDVTMLREPWDEMEPGVLYIGYEPKVIGIPWMVKGHPAYREWIDANGGELLLNAGVVGGEHAIVMEFCHDLAAEGLEVDHTGYYGDMAAINKLLRSPKWEGRWKTGPLVVSLFKHDDTHNAWSWWKHK